MYGTEIYNPPSASIACIRSVWTQLCSPLVRPDMNPRDWGVGLSQSPSPENTFMTNPNSPFLNYFKSPYIVATQEQKLSLKKKKKKAACFNSRNKSSQAIQNRCQEFLLNNQPHLLQKFRLQRITLASASWDALSAEEWKAAAAGTRDNGEAASRAQASHLGHSLCQRAVPSLSQLVILGSILYWKNSNVFCF